jgi:hypothetical protein
MSSLALVQKESGDRLAELLEAGSTVARAAKLVAAEYGIERDATYAAALEAQKRIRSNSEK